MTERTLCFWCGAELAEGEGRELDNEIACAVCIEADERPRRKGDRLMPTKLERMSSKHLMLEVLDFVILWAEAASIPTSALVLEDDETTLQALLRELERREKRDHELAVSRERVSRLEAYLRDLVDVAGPWADELDRLHGNVQRGNDVALVHARVALDMGRGA